MAHCIETLLEEKKKKDASKKARNVDFEKVYCKKRFHFHKDKEEEDEEKVYYNDLYDDRGYEITKTRKQDKQSTGDSRYDDHTDTMDLSKLMDLVTGTPEMVKTRQDYCRIKDELLHRDGFNVLFTGSQAEGLNLPESDMDFMHEYEEVKVAPSDLTDYRRSNADFMMAPSEMNPCFVLLRLTGKGVHQLKFLIESREIEGVCFISSLLFRNHCRAGVPNVQVFNQGPSLEIVHDHNSYDNVFCFKCTSWPPACDEWIHRQRQHNWPPDVLKEKILQSGVHLVPIGHPLSPQREMEWRVSFSVAERELVWSFNHIQMHCYAFLKIVLKEYIKPRFLKLCKEEMPLCSYFLKTILFWTIEETKSSFWTLENLAECFRYILRILYKHVRSGFLSHYFIPDFNLFEIKMKGCAKEIVTKILGDFVVLDIRDVINTCNTLRNAAIKMHKATNDIGYIEHFCFNVTVLCHSFNNKSCFFYEIVRLLSKVGIENELGEVFAKYMLSRLCNKYTRISANKMLYNIPQMRKIKDLEYDLTAAKLQCATFHLLQRDFHVCLKIINDMFSSIPPYAMYVSQHEIQNKSAIEIFKTMYRKEEIKISQLIICDLMYVKTEINEVPAAIQMELGYCNPCDFIWISPFVYSYYLMFLSYYGLRDISGQNRSLNMLVDAVFDKERYGKTQFRSFNIVGHCLWLLERHDDARSYFMASAYSTRNSWYKNHNSCYEYLSLLQRGLPI